MKRNYLTESDILGMKLKAIQLLERRQWGLRFRRPAPPISAKTLPELIEQDKAREKDGFPRKLKFKRALVGPKKVIVVPYIEETKLVHGEFEPKNIERISQFSAQDQEEEEEEEELGEVIGHGEGEVGDVIGEMPIPIGGEGEEGEGPEAGTEPGMHQEEIFERGKELIQKFQLPNLREKRKKVPVDEYTFELIDRFRGSGQILDKRETLKQIIKTNILLNKLDKDKIDTTKFLVRPEDKVFRVLSKERIWKSQAVVFFLRDYSSSMFGEPTQIIVQQHLMIYAWLMVQYQKLVIPRFIVHDTEAKEVTVEQYFKLGTGGGTFIYTGYQKIIEIIESEGLEKDYNIYVFQGTDGEDFDDGRKAIPLIRKLLKYVNRMGVCILKYPFGAEDYKSKFEQYIEQTDIPSQKDLFRMHIMPWAGVSEQRQIEAIKALIAQD